MSDELWTLNQAAVRLAMPYLGVRDLVFRRVIRGEQRPNGRIYVSAADVEQVANERAIGVRDLTGGTDGNAKRS